ncbi:TetR/AcrR family transcriptional regulator [Paenibacillus lemnae]|uniref:TetR/AcrR family transcriptional regulator n=1 Tax=Paenibacillus lemnae TaxID=1330551 RepID=A0A848M6G3_PAELE|nr:TetR/AcrR family transcriptional regulator [Paenibacillus lemnae]NMO96315.1 TetR/AcrR family transcriptional regulator [Paenibacillus lemnae]
MELSQVPLRELKKAKTRIALYEAFLSIIEKQTFREVMLEDVCRKAEVSKVTFFNLFRKKEDLLLYYMRLWLSRRIIEIRTDQLRGLQAVRHLYRNVAEGFREQPGIMPSLIAFLSEVNMHPAMPELSQPEVLLLFPEHVDQGAESPNMFALFQQCIAEAREDGRLRPDITDQTAVSFLFTTFYGAFLTSQLYASHDVMSFYEGQISLIEQKN